MKNSADQVGCYPQRPKAEADNSLRLFFPLTKYNTTLSPGFLGQRFNNLQRAGLLTSP